MALVSEEKWVEPVHIRALVSKMGSANSAGELMGLSGNALTEAMRNNKAGLVSELAAKNVLRELDELPTDTILVMRVKSDQISGLRAVLQAMRIKFSEL